MFSIVLSLFTRHKKWEKNYVFIASLGFELLTHGSASQKRLCSKCSALDHSAIPTSTARVTFLNYKLNQNNDCATLKRFARASKLVYVWGWSFRGAQTLLPIAWRIMKCKRTCKLIWIVAYRHFDFGESRRLLVKVVQIGRLHLVDDFGLGVGKKTLVTRDDTRTTTEVAGTPCKSSTLA